MRDFKSRNNVLLLFLTVTVMFFTGIGMISDAQSKDAENGLEVRIMIYSGRQNPTFMITDDTRLKEIESMLNNADAADKFSKSTVIPSRLGYAGVVVFRKGDPDVLSDVENFAVYAGYIEVKDKSTDARSDNKRFHVDEGSVLENYLLDQALAEKAIDQELYDLINKDR